MAEENMEFASYKDISELQKELEGMKGKKEVSTNDLHESMQKLANVISDMLEVFAAASAQLKMEEREYDAAAKKHELIISKLDKVLDQNKTIAEGMVAIVEMMKERLVAPAKQAQQTAGADEDKEELFKPAPLPASAPREWAPKPVQQEWMPTPEPMMPRRAMPSMQPMPAAQTAPSYSPQIPTADFGMELPPLGPEPAPDLDFPEDDFGLDEQPKKKGLFGMFKK